MPIAKTETFICLKIPLGAHGQHLSIKIILLILAYTVFRIHQIKRKAVFYFFNFDDILQPSITPKWLQRILI